MNGYVPFTLMFHCLSGYQQEEYFSLIPIYDNRANPLHEPFGAPRF